MLILKRKDKGDVVDTCQDEVNNIRCPVLIT